MELFIFTKEPKNIFDKISEFKETSYHAGFFMPKIHQNRKILNYPKTMLNCKLMITVQSTYYLKGDKMLNGFEESIKDMELTDEVRAALIKNANTLSSGLSEKNTELLNKNKLANELLSKGSEITAAEKEQLAELQEFKSSAELKLAEEAGKYIDAKALSQQNHQTAMDAASELNKKALEDANNISSGFESQLKAIVVDQEITKELIGLDVAKELQEVVHDSIKSKTTFTDDGKAMVGDKSLSEYMKEWADSPAGKASRLAPNNNGGGANGGESNNSNNGNSSKVKTEAERAAGINKRWKNQ